ncbi:MAG: Phage integrase, N-terminal SAM-like domain, partial [Myxococcaceae bacterium]|nr:Phage integrase, N-terminal SAM-like domain [Myxococcaceae bacterium]
MTKPQKQQRRLVAPGLWKLNTDLYEVRVRAKCPSTGTMLSRWRKVRGTMTEALAERERLQADLRLGKAEQAPETLSTYARSWLSTRLERGDWRETTAQRYAQALDLHVLPRFGHQLLDALTTREVEAALVEWGGSYSRATANGWLRVM